MRDYQKEMTTYLDGLKSRTWDSLDKAIDEIKRSKYICVFGAGMTSSLIVSLLRTLAGIKIDFMCDNDQTKWGNFFYGDLECISPAELEKYKGDVSIIIASMFWEEINDQLIKMNFNKIYVFGEYRLINGEFLKNKDNLQIIKQNTLKLIDILDDDKSKDILYVLIKNWFDLDPSGAVFQSICSKDRHYPAGIIDKPENEAFVDIGAYNGDTVIEFLEKTDYSFDAIHAFELDKDNFTALEATVNKLAPQLKDKIHLYNCGVWNEEKVLSYEAGYRKGEDSRIAENVNTGNHAKVVRLSDILKDKRVTYIKMDIEGAEMEALQGAEELIVQQKPKLAICLYHKPQHMWEIPLYLKKLVPEYRIYIRHHAVLDCETLCYAVI